MKIKSIMLLAFSSHICVQSVNAYYYMNEYETKLNKTGYSVYVFYRQTIYEYDNTNSKIKENNTKLLYN